MLNIYAKTLQNVLEELRPYYVKHDTGCYALDVEGGLPMEPEEFWEFKAEIGDLRDKNIALFRETERLQKDIDERKSAVDWVLSRKNVLLDSGLVTPEIIKKFARFEDSRPEAPDPSDSEVEQPGDPAAEQAFNDEVHQACLELDARDAAFDMIADRSRKAFAFEGGEYVARNEDGEMLYGRDGVSPMSVKEFVALLRLSDDSEHLFVPREA